LKILTITTRAGLIVTASVIVTGGFDLPYTKGRVTFSSARLEFTSPYPFLKGATPKSSIISLWSGGGFGLPFEIPLDMTCGGDVISNVINDGNTTAYPTITLYGQLVDANLLNETNSETFSLDYNIADASYVVLDTFNRTIILNGTTNLREYFSGDWLTLSAGSNGIKLTATSYGENAIILVSYYDHYLGV
jgi:hypothetical protein